MGSSVVGGVTADDIKLFRAAVEALGDGRGGNGRLERLMEEKKYDSSAPDGKRIDPRNGAGIGAPYGPSLDNLLERFHLDRETALTNARFVAAAVRHLTQTNPCIEDYIRFLLDVNASISANYLVAALSEPACVDAAVQVLLVYGPGDATARPLVGALQNPAQREPATQVLLDYGASDVTVRPLVGALANPERVNAASAVLVQYGINALPFIRSPIPGTAVYEPLTNVIAQIKAPAVIS